MFFAMEEFTRITPSIGVKVGPLAINLAVRPMAYVDVPIGQVANAKVLPIDVRLFATYREPLAKSFRAMPGLSCPSSSRMLVSR